MPKNFNNNDLNNLSAQNNEMVTNSNEGEVAKEEPTVVEPVKTDDVVAPVEANEKSQTKVNIVIIAALVVLLFVVAFVFIIPSYFCT